jgi:17beta-estradiol 17-dehydrogenase / very-long-chain 3-oxoacyl-CoA reductase
LLLILLVILITLSQLTQNKKYELIDCFTEVDSIYPNIRSQLSSLEITVLINNVGMSYKHPEFFEALDNKFLNDMITCNITSVNKMTSIVLPIMVKNKQGVIINNASGSGRVPTPLLTVYSATKAYVDFFSRALNIEYKSKGILVQSLCPYFVSTKLSQVRPNLTAPVPNQFVKESLKTIVTQPVTNGCLIHNIQVSEHLILISIRIFYSKLKH